MIVLFRYQEVCHCLESLGSKSQCYEIIQNGICKYLVRTFTLSFSFWVCNLFFYHSFGAAAFLNWKLFFFLLFVTFFWGGVGSVGQTSGGSGQHGGRAAASRVQADRRLRAALRTGAALPVPLLPEPAGAAHQPAGRVAHRDRPQEVKRRAPTIKEKPGWRLFSILQLQGLVCWNFCILMKQIYVSKFLASTIAIRI